MGGPSGKVLVASTASAVSGATPSDASIVDVVGYGTVNFFEGSASAPGMSNTISDSRTGDGCTDADDNAADFSAGAVTPRNSAAPINLCGSSPGLVINEFSASTTGADVEFVEVLGAANSDFSAYSVLEIEGDSNSNIGLVDAVISLGSSDADGFYLASLSADTLENGTLSLLLVENFTGMLNEDLDMDNDGSFDVTPWDSIDDSVAVNDGSAGDLTYGDPELGPNYDGVSSFAPGGRARFPDGVDTDLAVDWIRNDFELAGIPGLHRNAGPGRSTQYPRSA